MEEKWERKSESERRGSGRSEDRSREQETSRLRFIFLKLMWMYHTWITFNVKQYISHGKNLWHMCSSDNDVLILSIFYITFFFRCIPCVCCLFYLNKVKDFATCWIQMSCWYTSINQFDKKRKPLLPTPQQRITYWVISFQSTKWVVSKWFVMSTLTAANKKKQMGICSSDATPGMQGGGRRGAEWEERREDGEWWGIPSDYRATWVFPCLNKAEFRHFKDLTPPVPRREPFDPLWCKNLPQLESRATQLLLFSTTQTRQVASSAPLLRRYNMSPSANSFKQNKYSVFMLSGCTLTERILLSQQQGVHNKDCGKCVFQQQEIRNVSSVGVKSGCTRFKLTA